LNGFGAPANNLGLAGDFYVDNDTHVFYGPKLNDLTWAEAVTIILVASGANYSYNTSWEIAQIVTITPGVLYKLRIDHNLGFFPNATCKDSSGNIVETGIEFNDLDTITLTMAQPFSGTAYLS
jgi:hypothetical protein